MQRPNSAGPNVDRSPCHSVRDAAAYALMTGGGETYCSVYAALLKASPAQVAVSASLTPLLGSFAYLMSA